MTSKPQGFDEKAAQADQIIGKGEMNNAPFEDSLGYLFRDTHRLISRRLQERLERAGIGLGQWYLLRALWQEDNLTQRELSGRIGMGEPNAVTALRVLENSGLVRRKVDVTDNRRKLVKLTPKGRALQSKMLPIADEVNDAIGAVLTAEERAQLCTMIARVRRGLMS